MSIKYRAVCLSLFMAWSGYSQDAQISRSDSGGAAKTANNNPTAGQAPGSESAALIFKSIIPPQLVNDMFGKRISDDYLAIQVTVFNTSEDEDLLINDVSVDYGALIPSGTCLPFSYPDPAATDANSANSANSEMAARVSIGSLQSQSVNVKPGDARFMAASSSQVLSARKSATESGQVTRLATCQTSSQELSILRGVAEKGQILDTRNLVYRSLQAVGTVGGALTGVAGLGPILPKAVAAFNGPGLSAFSTLLPDFTVNQMNRLSDSAYAANAVVARQRSKVLVAFIPMQLFFSPKDIKDFRKDAYSAFMGVKQKSARKSGPAPAGGNTWNAPAPPATGLKDLRVRVAYNFIVSTEDVPPLPTTMTIADNEVLNLLRSQPAHGTIGGRFLEDSTVATNNSDYDVSLDGNQASTDTRLYFVITPKKAIFPASLGVTVRKAKSSADIAKQITAPQPMPTLTGVSPSAIPQGADTNVTLTGSNFFDLPATLVFAANGAAGGSLAVANVVVVSPTQITATVSAKDAQLGTYGLSVMVGASQTGKVALTVTAAP